MAKDKIFQYFLHSNAFFMFILLISNHTVCEFFYKLKLHSPKRLVQFNFEKNSLVQINSKLNLKPSDYLYLFIHKRNRGYYMAARGSRAENIRK